MVAGTFYRFDRVSLMPSKKPDLALIPCDRSQLERHLLHVACTGSNAELAAAVAAFERRAQLHVVRKFPVADESSEERQ
jgi:hypothetical protein